MSKEVDDAKLLVTLLKVIKNQNTKISEELKISLKTQIDEIVIPSPVKGEKGEAGIQGIPGIPGDRGDKGERGIKGDPGGESSIKGDPGSDRGIKGYLVGERGDKGDRGDKGERGDKGNPGNTGLQGAQGIQGEVGAAGKVGPQGIQGEIGARGVPGYIGPSGKDGSEGSIGPIGEAGSRGPIGESGPIGKQGEVGPQGIQGKTGPHGLPGPKGDPGSDANVAPLEKKFEQFSKTVDTKLSRIAYSAATGTSAGSGEVNLRNLDDVDYNSVSSPTNGQVLTYNSTVSKWQANSVSGGVSTATFNSALANTNSYIDSKLTKTNPSIAGTLSVTGTTTLTSLILSTVLSPIYGGTGLNSVTVNGVLVGANSSSFGYVTGSSGGVFQLNSNTAPVFAALDGGSF